MELLSYLKAFLRGPYPFNEAFLKGPYPFPKPILLYILVKAYTKAPLGSGQVGSPRHLHLRASQERKPSLTIPSGKEAVPYLPFLERPLYFLCKSLLH